MVDRPPHGKDSGSAFHDGYLDGWQKVTDIPPPSIPDKATGYDSGLREGELAAEIMLGIRRTQLRSASRAS